MYMEIIMSESYIIVVILLFVITVYISTSFLKVVGNSTFRKKIVK